MTILAIALTRTSLRGIPEPVEPPAGDRQQALPIQLVDPLAPPLLDADDASLLQHPKVTRRGGPGAGETIGDGASSQLAAAEPEGQHDVPPLLVSQGPEDGLEVGEPLCGERELRAPRQSSTGSTDGNSMDEQQSPMGSQTAATSGSEWARCRASGFFQGKVST
jgi:hypothetical protein